MAAKWLKNLSRTKRFSPPEPPTPDYRAANVSDNKTVGLSQEQGDHFRYTDSSNFVHFSSQNQNKSDFVVSKSGKPVSPGDRSPPALPPPPVLFQQDRSGSLKSDSGSSQGYLDDSAINDQDIIIDDYSDPVDAVNLVRLTAPHSHSPLEDSTDSDDLANYTEPYDTQKIFHTLSKDDLNEKESEDKAPHLYDEPYEDINTETSTSEYSHVRTQTSPEKDTELDSIIATTKQSDIAIDFDTGNQTEEEMERLSDFRPMEDYDSPWEFSQKHKILQEHLARSNHDRASPNQSTPAILSSSPMNRQSPPAIPPRNSPPPRGSPPLKPPRASPPIKPEVKLRRKSGDAIKKKRPTESVGTQTLEKENGRHLESSQISAFKYPSEGLSESSGPLRGESPNMNIPSGETQVPDMYEDPWDLQSKQMELERKIKHASRTSSAFNPPSTKVSPPNTFRPVSNASLGTLSGIKCEVYIPPRPSSRKSSSPDVSDESTNQIRERKMSKTPDSLTNQIEDDRPGDDYDEPWHVRQSALLSQMDRGSPDISKRAPARLPPDNQSYHDTPHSLHDTPQHSPKKRQHNLNVELGSRTLNAVGEKVDPAVELERQRWYHGSVSRQDAESLLRVHKEGSYLVRQSESNKEDYSLSLKSIRGFMHMKIVQRNGSYILGQYSQPYPSIPDMICHYSVSKLPIKGAEHMSLLHPVLHELL